MSKVKLKHWAYTVKESYVASSGDTDTLTYENLPGKISEAVAGENIGYKIRFVVDNNPYYIASCQQGESITEPPTPTKAGETFTAWQLNSVDVSFPYTPNADVELTASFATVRTEMELKNAGDFICGNLYKKYDGTAVAGRTRYWGGNTWGYRTVLLAQTQEPTIMTGDMAQGTITYDDNTWYYSYNMSQPQNENIWYIDGISDINTLCTKILDHYFYKD